MTRDYKSRANARQKTRRPVPGWVWFLVGMLVGLFFSGLAWLKLLPADGKTAPPPFAGNPAPKAERERSADRAPAPRPRFDFYTILPEMEVVVPEPEVETRNTARKQPVPGGGAETDRYMLQMGSFRKYSDADRLKASLALVGIEAEIQKVRIDSGEIFHRVRAGPYTPDKVKLLSARLKENRISSLMIKLR